ncbi:DNA-binding protein C1D involved in regulation of double-strand break repair [Phytophthora cinnamomi]|uniref:DNA-binding protein C1D involved in regulation of double-strand break repair n=1 Tax=Phytophthora cinnamomi TaxID=4785 RepID=UPI00355A8AF6|nr:DNA-binding protein C1D involved in regulation of double-strand break repair [Phytophthora cinnamomi]
MSEQAVEAFASVEQTLAAVEEHLAVFKQSSMEEVVAPLSPLERAKVQVSLAYTINALLFVFLKTQGVSPKDIRQTHVKQELERVKAFIKKIKDAEELAKGPKLVLDKDASKRFIHNALSSDQVYVDAVKAKKDGQDSKAEDKSKTDAKTESKGKRAASKSSGKKNKRQRKH